MYDDDGFEYMCQFDSLYEKLDLYIHWLASRNATAHPLMDREELRNDLLYEVIKGWKYYEEAQLPNGQLLAVIRKMLDNRISELKYKYFITGRKVEVKSECYDDMEFELSDDDSLAESREKVEHFLTLLTEAEFDVVRAILRDDDRIRQQIRVRTARKSFVYKKTIMRINFALVAEAMHEGPEFREVWNSIRDKWQNPVERIHAMNKSDLVKRFGKSAIYSICEELGLEADTSVHVFRMLESIESDLDENGIPEVDDCSDDLYDMLIAIGYIDEEGELIDIQEGGATQPVSKGDLPDTLPDCWGCVDEDDLACGRCTLHDKCIVERGRLIDGLECFGVMYEPKVKECSICLYWKLCEKEQKSINAVSKPKSKKSKKE